MTRARRLFFCGALLFSVVVSARSSSAQASDYERLVDEYAGGESTHAIAELAGWPEARLRAAFAAGEIRVKSALPPLPEDRIKAAVMLHTETALAITNQQLAFIHIDRARALLASVPKDDRERLGFATFSGRWVAIEAILYASFGDMRQAQRVLDDALRPNPDNVDALLVRGALQYVQLAVNEPNPRGRWNASRASNTEALPKASYDVFSALVSRHPESLEARLRLAWAMLINHSPTGRAREQLDVVAAKAQRDDLRYLAHLFLGAVEARDGRMDEAAAEYAKAKGIMPGQAAYAGLIQVDRERGLTDESERLAIEFASARRPLDPWQPFNAGLTSNEIMEWLRNEAVAR